MSGFPAFSTQRAPKPSSVHLTSASLQRNIDLAQPPTKRSPWRQVRESPFVRAATLVMPEEVYQLICPSGRALPQPRYGRVTLTLTEILTDANGWWWSNAQLMMFSVGRSTSNRNSSWPGVDDARFEIRDGKLRMELSRQIYEKCGLQGQPLSRRGSAMADGGGRSSGGGGRSGLKIQSWYEVQVQLVGTRPKPTGRALDRVLWAAKNVLDCNGSFSWLVVNEPVRREGDFHEKSDTTTWTHVEGEVSSLRVTGVPEQLQYSSSCDLEEAGELEGKHQQQQRYDEDDWYEMVEWLDMVALDSDGVKDIGPVDSYIGRYRGPAAEDSALMATELRVVKWTGLLSWSWVTALLVEIVKRSKSTEAEHLKSCSWLALSAVSHRTEAVRRVDGYTVVLQSPPTNNKDVSEEREEEKGKGFQRSRCFQFMDSNC